MVQEMQQMGFAMPGGYEWMVILVVGLLIFGRRLPEIARGMGKSVTEFKKGLNDFRDSTDDVVGDVNKLKDEVVSEAKDAAGLDDVDGLT